MVDRIYWSASMAAYLISSKKEGETMATYLEYGSDTFKTWEDIITYFSHLGGQ